MKANIVIMGQSGNGKSTIVNAIMGTEVAKTGKGSAITTKNEIYTTFYKLDTKVCTLNLYDTVGIELSESVTQATLIDIENHLKESQKQSDESDVNVVWFCINNRSSRFQDFEIDLIRKLSYDYEIPFIIVMTQCFDNQLGELERDIRKELPDVVTTHIMAKDYPLRGGTVIPAYGIDDLLRLSINDYNNLKVHVLESKLHKLQQNVEISEWYIKSYEDKAKECVAKYADNAMKIGLIPGGCIPVIRGMCIKMIAELHQIYGLSSSEVFADNVFSNIIVGFLLTPFMVVPLLSASVACSYVSYIGDEYTQVLSGAIKNSKYSVLGNQKIMMDRIREQLLQRKGR